MEWVATALPYDYIIGSVHRVDGEEVDRASDQGVYEKWDTYDLYDAYYANVREAALSERFDVLGHPDLIKIFRHFPIKTSRACSRRPLRRWPSPASWWT